MKAESETKAESGTRKAGLSSAFASVRIVAIAFLVAGCFLTTGCRSWNPWGKGFDDEYANMGAKARGGSSNNQGAPSLGLSAKSRQIERNLGIE